MSTHIKFLDNKRYRSKKIPFAERDEKRVGRDVGVYNAKGAHAHSILVNHGCNTTDTTETYQSNLVQLQGWHHTM